MNKSVIIAVHPLEKKPSHQVKHVQHLLKALGNKELELKSITSLFRLEGDFSAQDAQKAAEEILCDPVVESYSVNAAPKDDKTFFADVWYKPGVTDSVGDSVLKALRDINVISVEKSFAGVRYEFCANFSDKNVNAREKIKEFTSKQLLNPLVQECLISKL